MQKEMKKETRGGYKLYALYAKICCVFLLCAAIIGGAIFAFPLSNKNAEAMIPSDIANSTKISEITLKDYSTRNDGKAFNAFNLSQIYASLTGNSNASFSDVESLVAGTYNLSAVTLSNAYTSAQIRSANGGKNVVIKFGGYEWVASYLTKANNGDVILDLWLTNTSQIPAAYRTSSFSDGSGYSTGTSMANPSGLYGSSKIRVSALNAGGDYYSFSFPNQTTQGVKHSIAQNANHAYAKFTMPSVTDSLTDYIVRPVDVKYQEVEADKEWINSGYQYSMANEAWGTPHFENYYVYGGENYGFGGNGTNKKTASDLWKNDYLWLPSTTEVGWSTGGGYWDTEPAMYHNNVITNRTESFSGTNAEYTWLRTMDDNASCLAYYLANSSFAWAMTSSTMAVRPALHLNLTKAENASVFGRTGHQYRV